MSLGKRILLIDGEPGVHETFRELLLAGNATRESVPTSPILQGLEVDSAGDGPEGLATIRESLQQQRPYLLAVVAADLCGEWDGLDTVRRVWQEDATLPVLLSTPENCTANDRHEMVRKLGQIDRFLFLSKPLDPAGNGSEVLAVLRRRPYDLVLMDVEMPEMDGLSAIEHIRQQEATTGGHVPIVVLTANAMPGDRQRCLEAGADDYLTKPVTPELLIGTVQRFLPGCLAEFDSPAGAGGTPDEAQASELTPEAADYVRDLHAALEKENFHGLENTAAALKNLAVQFGLREVADHAMRVQLAARSSDLRQAAAAIRRLQTALGAERSPVAASESSLFPRGGTDREVSDCR